MTMLTMKVNILHLYKYYLVSFENVAFLNVLEEEEDVKPWEENNGYYGILSRLVKSFNPNFIFTVKPSTIDYPYLTKDQIVNHYNKNGAFTTKVTTHIITF